MGARRRARSAARRGRAAAITIVLAGMIVAVSAGPSGATTLVPAPSGAAPHVRTFTPIAVGSPVSRASFFGYPTDFAGGTTVAAGDLDGDGRDEIITGAGFSGGPHVRVFSASGAARGEGFMAYAPEFTGGVDVAAGDIDGDGRAEILTGAGPGGGSHVRVFAFRPGTAPVERAGFLAYDPSFRGGVDVAAADIDGDGRAEILTGAGPGGGPHVRVFRSDGTPVGAGFLAYDPGFRGGVAVGGGDLDGDRRAEVVTGAGPGGGPHVRIFRVGRDGGATAGAERLAYDAAFTGGVRVATVQADADRPLEVVTAPGYGGGPHVKVFDSGFVERTGFLAYDPAFTAGVDVGGSSAGTLVTGAGGAHRVVTVPDGPRVYLTFDDGPWPVFTDQILALLRQHDAKATFFAVGQEAARRLPLVQAALDAGHTVANHTWAHSDLTRLSPAAIVDSLHRTQAVLGPAARQCLRPPYGSVNGTVRTVTAQQEYPLQLWTIDTMDYRRRGPAAIARAALSRVTDGSVILMHDGGGDRSQTVAALPEILTTLRARGFRFERMCT